MKIDIKDILTLDDNNEYYLLTEKSYPIYKDMNSKHTEL